MKKMIENISASELEIKTNSEEEKENKNKAETDELVKDDVNIL